MWDAGITGSCLTPLHNNTGPGTLVFKILVCRIIPCLHLSCGNFFSGTKSFKFFLSYRSFPIPKGIVQGLLSFFLLPPGPNCISACTYAHKELWVGARLLAPTADPRNSGWQNPRSTDVTAGAMGEDGEMYGRCMTDLHLCNQYRVLMTALSTLHRAPAWTKPVSVPSHSCCLIHRDLTDDSLIEEVTLLSLAQPKRAQLIQPWV